MRQLATAAAFAAAVALTALAAPAGAAPPARPAAPPAPAIKDSQLGLSKTSVFEVPSPPDYRAEGSSPGEKPPPPRAGREAPPVIPHAVADFLPITPTQNACADCHVVDGARKPGEPTPVPASHFVDLRRAPDRKGEKLAGARWVCISCHVARTDAPPAVGSTYRP